MNHGGPNQIVLRIDPSSGLRIGLTSQGAGRGWRTVRLDMLFAEELGPELEPYERLLRDAIAGDSYLFTRGDTGEEAGRAVQPLLDTPQPGQEYPKGSWGAPAAARL